ncbi:ERMES complex subunit [Actinomortierella ambigua]|nr:ERMES complex subunit [Actinomortierella ambigua]
MAFRFQWPYFSQEFINEAKTMLTNALNKGNKPALIVDHITVKELDMGTVPPELEILEIGEVSMERFRGIFKLTYNGDAHVVLQTKVQANPMNVKKSDNLSYTRRGILAADQPLVVPMLLRISDFKLRGIIVLVVDQIKGITLVFKNDPLESVLVSSTFDSITPIQRFLQSEIEKQLRNLFREDLPTAIHNLSQQFTKKPEDTPLRSTPTPVGLSVPPSTYASPVASRQPSRRSSRIAGMREGPSSEPDMTPGVDIHFGDNMFDRADQPSTRKGSSTTRSESPPGDKGHRRRRRDPHTNVPRSTTSEPYEDGHHSEEEADERETGFGNHHHHGHGDGQGHGGNVHDTQTLPLQDFPEIKEKPIRRADSAHVASQFANLIHSNQTISPFTQNLEHFTFRSVPPKRPESVQYYSREALLSHSPSIASAPPDIAGGEGAGQYGQSAHSRLLAAKMAAASIQNANQPSFGLSPGSPRISHKRMEGRIGIRRYNMQLGGPSAPRELSDHEDEYSDAEEALSETEYVHVERPSTEDESAEEAEDDHPYSTSHDEDDSELHHGMANMRFSGKRAGSSSAGRLSSSPPPLSPMAVQQQKQQQHRLPPSFLSSSSLPSPTSVVSRSTLAHHFAQRNPNHHQRYSQPSPRVAPPTALKRDKRNSSILSARRVSSAGIGLGVLSRDSKEKLGMQSSPGSKLSTQTTAID